MPEDIKQQYKSVYQDGFFFSIFGVNVKELCFFGKSCQKAPVLFFYCKCCKRGGGGHSFTFLVNLSEPGMWCQRWWPYWPTGAPLDDAGGERFHQQKSRKTNQPKFTTLFPRNICYCFWLDGSLVVVDFIIYHSSLKNSGVANVVWQALCSRGHRQFSDEKQTWLFRRF